VLNLTLYILVDDYMEYFKASWMTVVQM